MTRLHRRIPTDGPALQLLAVAILLPACWTVPTAGSDDRADQPRSSVGFVLLNDLGQGFYQGKQGGLLKNYDSRSRWTELPCPVCNRCSLIR